MPWEILFPYYIVPYAMFFSSEFILLSVVDLTHSVVLRHGTAL
jgi:hypothetical protein